MTIDPESVNATFSACLAHSSSVDPVTVEGVVRSATFTRATLEEHRAEIEAMLDQLPEQFKKATGGGWSFLQACDDRDGRQWTGMHLRMEQLFMLGMGIGMVSFLLPRELWDALPGGMPYLQIHAQGDAPT